MTSFLHTMYRITDPERSRAFYEALGFTFSRDMDIVRDGQKEAPNYFFSATPRTSSSSRSTTTGRPTSSAPAMGKAHRARR